MTATNRSISVQINVGLLFDLTDETLSQRKALSDERSVSHERVGVTSIGRRSISDGSVTIEINMRTLFQFCHETGSSDLTITIQVHAKFLLHLSRDKIYMMSRIGKG